MKLGAAERERYLKRPDEKIAAALLYGPDAMRVALKRQDLIAALVGPEGEAEMRLTRLAGGDLRRDPAALADAMRAGGFFPGRRAVLVDGAVDAAAPALKAALEQWQPGDATIVIEAGDLKPSSALRKLVEAARNGAAMGIYADPPGRAEIEAAIAAAGLPAADAEAAAALAELGRALDPGDYRQFLEKLSLYCLGQPAVTAADVAAVMPPGADAELDTLIAGIAEGAVDAVGRDLGRLGARGSGPVALCVATARHFRMLHAAASHPGGAEAALARQRPPVFGPRRDRILRQARAWGAPALERALTVLTDTDLAIRSSRPWPDRALAERTLIRVAMMCPRT